MSDDDFDEFMEMVEREEAERNRDLGLDFMDVVGTFCLLIDPALKLYINAHAPLKDGA